MRSEFSELLFHREPVISVRSLDSHAIGCLFVSPTEVDREVQEQLRSYDFIYSWLGSNQPDFVKNLEALLSEDLRMFSFHSLNPKVHMTDYYLSCVENSTLPSTFPVTFPEIALSSDAQVWCQRFWEENRLYGKRILALAPGSGSSTKNWPVAFFKTVARWWMVRTGGEVLILWGPAEEERMVDPLIWEGAILVRGLGLGQLAALQARSDIYLGNDSGPTHLAAAMGVPTVALFGPTDPVQWAPWGSTVRVLRQRLDCSPCGLAMAKACNYRGCLAELSPDRVLAMLEGILTGGVLDKEVGRL